MKPMTNEYAESLIDRDSEPLGTGVGRVVYAIPSDPTSVMKVARDEFANQNSMEWLIWNEIKVTPDAKYFAEVRSISASRKYLIMERLEPVPPNPVFSHKPSWLKDFKGSQTVGKAADENLKIFDYGNITLSQVLCKEYEPYAPFVTREAVD